MAAPLPPDRFERRAVISGIGQSEVGRRIYREPLDLTVDAVLEAIDDAGLTPADIDGIATHPGNQDVPPGFEELGVGVGLVPGRQQGGRLGQRAGLCLSSAVVFLGQPVEHGLDVAAELALLL